MFKEIVDFSKCQIQKEILDITESTVTLHNETPVEVGTDISVEIKLPEEILLDSFNLEGSIKACRHMQNNGSTGYLLEMSIGDIPLSTKKILEAYIDFLKREKQLNEIKIDYNALEDVFVNFGKQMDQLLGEATQLLKKTTGNFTIH